MGGNRISPKGPGDDGWDEDGYDESQRAEIIEATQDAPSDGTLLTDIPVDLGGEPDGEPIDDIDLTDDVVADVDPARRPDLRDRDEDELQADFDDDALDDPDADDALDDTDRAALEP